MSKFKIHSVASAPKESKPFIEKFIKNGGSIPNLHGVLAESPPLIEAYQTLHGLFRKTSFDKEEQTVVWQTANVEHACHYCVPAHTGIANNFKVDKAITEALRNETALPTPKLQALHNMTLSIIKNRGNVNELELDAFYAAGYTQKHILEIILGLSQKVISNYTNHFAQTPIDPQFEPFAWVKSESK